MFGNDFQNMYGSYAQKAKELLIYYKGSVPLDKRDHYDYTPARFKKRVEVATKDIVKVKEHLKGVCDDRLIEAYFAFTNSLIMRGGYNDAIDFCNQTITAAAIWILDQLSLQGKLEESYPFMPELTLDDGIPTIIAPIINHPMHDYETILSMCQLIRQRNTSKPFDEKAKGTLQWDAKRPDRDAASRKNRADFDSVMRLLDKKAIERAVKKYEADVWHFYQLSFRAYSLLEKHYSHLENDLLANIKNAANVLNRQAQTKELSVLVDSDIKDMKRVLASSDDQDLAAEILREEEKQISRSVITFTELSLANDREKTVRNLGKIIPEDLAEELIHFHVDDPFESAFALLYLLDKDSNIPWFYYGSISVAYTMCDQLPYDISTQNVEEPVLLSDFNSALYAHRFSGYRWAEITDASEEPVQRSYAKNLSQLLYADSLAVFPRVIPKVASLDSFLEGFGELTDCEREAYSLLLYSLHAGNMRRRSESLEEYRFAKEAEDSIDSDPIDYTEVPQNSEEIQQKEIERLRSKNARLLAVLKENQERKGYDHHQLEILTETVEKQKKELTDLREKVFLLAQGDYKEEPEDNTIPFPYHTKGKILSFGGHSSWITEMKKKLPNVVFISPNMLPNADLIRGADEVWIQTNCISHKDYYRIMETIRSMDKQVRYFVYAGVNKCAEQVVKACEQAK